MFSKPLSKRLKNKWSLAIPALATAGAGAGFFLAVARPPEAFRALLGVGAAALFGAFAGWQSRTAFPNLIFLALLLTTFGAGAGALILTEGTAMRIMVAIATVLAGLTIMLGERSSLGEAGTAWIPRARRGALLLVAFLLGANAAAFTTYLRISPTLVGFAVIIPLWSLILADTLFEGRGLPARRVIGSGAIAILCVEMLMALLALPLTFTAVGAAFAVALALLREIAERAVEAGVFTIPFLKRIAVASFGALMLILGTARWS